MFRAVTLLLLAAAVPAAGQQQSFWELVVNDVPRGELIAVLVGDDTWIPVTGLEQAGLIGVAGVRRTFFNTPHVSLDSLAPDITYQRDETEVVLRIIAAPRFFDTTVVVFQRDRPNGISYASTPAVFSNYSVTWDERSGNSYFGESGISMFGNTSLASSYSVEADDGFVRGLSTMTIDRASARLRLQVGDTVPVATPLGSAPILAGASIGRDYSLDPYYFRHATPFLRGTATAPSDVEVFVNGALVRRLQVGPGPFRFDRLPVNAGLGDVRVIVRDPFGRQRQYNLNFYQPISVLRRGEHDFQFAGGKLRDDTGPQPVYGGWQGAAFQRVGVTDWLTLGYSGEGAEDVVAGGPTLSTRLGRLGELELNGWFSQAQAPDQVRGFAAYGTYSFVAPWLNLSATGQYYDKGFANLYLEPDTVSTPEYYVITTGVPLFSAGSLNYAWEYRRSPAGGFGLVLPDGSFDPQRVVSRAHTARLNFRLPFASQLTTTATYTQVRDLRYWTGFAGLNIVLGNQGATASVTYSKQQDTENTFLDINKSLPLGPGVAYRLTASDVEGGTAGGQVEVNTRWNRLRVDYDATRKDDARNARATLSGGIAASRAGLYFTRPLTSSAAVVEVQGLKNVRVLVDNTPVGRTNGRGKLMINELLPYLANRISYVEEDIPFDYKVPVSWQLVAPPYRGAAYVRFLTSRIQARTGTVVLLIEGERVVPSYGTIVVALDGRAVESPLNAGGEFFLDLPVGRHTGTVTFKGQACDVQFEARTGAGLSQNVGTLTCAP